MSYERHRRAIIRAHQALRLSRFLARYVPGRPTIVLLPGGMGTQLSQSARPFGGTPAPDQITSVIWADFGLFLTSDGVRLGIDRDGRDDRAHVVAPDGPFNFMSETPYDEFEAFCGEQGWNYVVLGYDWRRRLPEAAELLATFLANLRSEVQRRFREDPLPSTTLACHSMGGLVAALAFRDAALAALPLNAVVTVATPFYGTWSQQERYYMGQQPLNAFYFRDQVARLVGGFPGPYSLMFLPNGVFEADGARLGLARHPLRDAGAPDRAVDAYGGAARSRWPASVDFRYVEQNRRLLTEIARPILPQIAPRVFNLRAARVEMAVELSWDRVNGATYQLGGDDNPIHVLTRGPGDGTVPAWSAFHAHARDDNRRDLRQAFDHGRLFEHAEVWSVIASLVERGTLPRIIRARSTSVTPTEPASLTRARRVMTEAAARPQAPPPTDLQVPNVRRAIMYDLMGMPPRTAPDLPPPPRTRN